jgi:subfamily B ATP-binding cassette protein MsbA
MFALSIAGMLVFASTEPLFAAMIKPLLDGSFVDRDPDVVRLMPILLVGIFLVRGIAGFVNTYCLKWVGRRVVADLRQEMFDHLLRSPTRYYDTNGSGPDPGQADLQRRERGHGDDLGGDDPGARRLQRHRAARLHALSGCALSAIFLLIGPIMAFSIKYATKRFRRYGKRIQERVGS